MQKPDKYDDAIKNLQADQIHDAWNDVYDHPAGCLFGYAGVNEKGERTSHFGCLTQIRKDAADRDAYVKCRAQTVALTEAIIADDRIPTEVAEITLDHLPIFAEWQRRIDKELKELQAV